ncbi:HTH 24 domain containing protein [Asbolus verrucosus]|uniref:HTH 24 domain containing protein n=1 Tax=Asbolus verrucosus TaxID=1661398 RepID=A0A482VP50_ASBVE|nr:HTH 24 domain containing protein [Asbolus verrucosus]
MPLVESYFRNATNVNAVWTYSAQNCMEEFRAEFPEVVVIYRQFQEAVSRCIEVSRESGSVTRKKDRSSRRTDETINAAEEIENEPRTSIRRLAQQMDLSVGTCHAILRKDMHIYPYKITSVQELLPVDPPRRLEFCNWFLNGLNNDDDTLRKSFCTDEAWFHRTD